MLKSSLIITIIAGFVFLATSSFAQSGSIVDPGVSVHNYKHPNKAAKAKENRSNTVRVANLNTVERFTKSRSGHTSSTPKYAPRAATLVVLKSYEVEKVAINPHISNRNYKAQSGFVNKEAELAVIEADSVYPNQD